MYAVRYVCIDLQLLRNGSLNAQQVKTLKTAWTSDRWLCIADHGNSTCCCDQASKCPNDAEVGMQCRADKPVCKGFRYGSVYGICVGN